MLKGIEKHKFFFLVLFALVVMSIGCFFVIPEGNAEFRQGSVEVYFNVKSAWKNSYTDETYNYGDYVSEAGNVYTSGAGVVSTTKPLIDHSYSIPIESAAGAPGKETVGYTKNKFLATEEYYSGFIAEVSSTITATANPGFNYVGMGQVSKYDFTESEIKVSDLINSSGVNSNSTVNWGKDKEYFWTEQDKVIDWYFVAMFYPKTYNIYFNVSGGYWEDGSIFSKRLQTKAYENYVFPEKEPTREGYEFDGWWIHSFEEKIPIWHPDDGRKEVIFDDVEYELSGTRIELFAHWKAKESRITFEKQGGNGGTDSATAVYDMSLPNITVPTLEGHSFLGYFTLTSGGTQYFNSDGEGVINWDIIAKEVTLYAQWIEHTYKIIFNKNSTEASGTMNDMSLSYTESKALTANAYTRTGYTFSGWATSDSGAVVYSDRATVCGLTSVDGGTINLYAVWSENSYTIAFNNNGGSGTITSKTLTYTESWTLTINTFIKAGYLFEKWNTKSDGTGTNYLDGASVSKLSSINGTTVTLYAKWQSTWATDVATPRGSGTLAEPYEISSAKNLAWIASQTTGTIAFNKHCKQTRNISLSGKVWLPIGTSSAKFTGSYDGNGYVITNINSSTVKNASDNYIYSQIGLFGYTSGATINRVTILSSTMYGHNQVGVLVGSANDSTKISMCQTKGTVSISGQYAGGICGDLRSSSSLTKSVSSATVNGGKNAGGLVGYAGLVTITSSGFTGTVSGTDCALLVGYASKDYSAGPTITDCFAHGTGSTSFYKGSGAKSITSCLYSSGTTKKYYDGSFTGWVKIGSTTIPKDLAWITSIGESTAKATIINGYSKV